MESEANIVNVSGFSFQAKKVAKLQFNPNLKAEDKGAVTELAMSAGGSRAIGVSSGILICGSSDCAGCGLSQFLK
jgi:hypothetical protein